VTDANRHSEVELVRVRLYDSGLLDSLWKSGNFNLLKDRLITEAKGMLSVKSLAKQRINK